MKLPQLVYRELLVAARALDRNVALRALVSTNMLVPPVAGQRETRLPHAEAFNKELLTFLENRSYYLPSRDRVSVEATVREKFRAPLAPEEARQAMDTAFVALKALNGRMAHAIDAGILQAPRGHKKKKASGLSMLGRAKAKRSKLVKELTLAQALREKAVEKPPLSVRAADHVTTGVFLLAHPMMNGIFGRSVILLTDHSSKGTTGFIVNQPTKVPLMKRFKVHPRILRAFGANNVHKGGPLRTDFAEIFHTQVDLGGEKIVTSNFKTASNDELFQGINLDEAAQAVAAGKIQQSDVVFINGVSSWTPGQLDKEMQLGTWVAVRAPLSVAIGAQKELWSEMMARLGGEYEELSRVSLIDDADEFDEEEEEDLDEFAGVSGSGSDDDDDDSDDDE